MDVFIYDVLIHNMKKITALGFHPLRSLFFKVGAKWGIPFINDIKMEKETERANLLMCTQAHYQMCISQCV